MNYCALVEATRVQQIIVSELQWAVDNLSGEWHDLGDNSANVAIGWIKTDNGFIPPPTPPEPEL